MHPETGKALPNVVATIEHQYLTDCVLVRGVQIYYILYSIVYLCLSALWIHQVWYKFENHSTNLQRTMVAIPVLKVF
jgi:hypothetical protein